MIPSEFVTPLDTIEFDQLVELARGEIPRYAPDWTDHNVHDPGMTLVDLLAWIVDQQVYRAGHVGGRHLRAFAALLGRRAEGPAPARGLVWPAQAVAEGRLLQAGTEVRCEAHPALRVVTDRQVYLTPAALVEVDLTVDGVSVPAPTPDGVTWTVDGAGGTGPRDRHRADAAVRRGPGHAGDDRADRARPRGRRAARPAAVAGDLLGPGGLGVPGRRRRVGAPAGRARRHRGAGEDRRRRPHRPARAAGRRRGPPPAGPRLLPRAPAGPRRRRQRLAGGPARARSACDAGGRHRPAGPDGRPLDRRPGPGSRRRPRLAIEVDGEPWSEHDLATSGPDDPHYAVSPDTVVFGNGVNGRRPPPGATIAHGDLLRTAGSGGNLRPGLTWSVPVLGPAPYGVNRHALAGGRDATTATELLAQARAAATSRAALLTDDDLAAAAHALPGMAVGRAEVLPRFDRRLPDRSVDGVRTLVVAPTGFGVGPDGRAEVPRAYLRQVAARLGGGRVLGERLVVQGPAVVVVDVAVPRDDPGVGRPGRRRDRGRGGAARPAHRRAAICGSPGRWGATSPSRTSWRSSRASTGSGPSPPSGSRRPGRPPTTAGTRHAASATADDDRPAGDGAARRRRRGGRRGGRRRRAERGGTGAAAEPSGRGWD